MSYSAGDILQYKINPSWSIEILALLPGEHATTRYITTPASCYQYRGEVVTFRLSHLSQYWEPAGKSLSINLELNSPFLEQIRTQITDWRSGK